ncbi:sensor domain-containing protein [Mycobacterium sp.]|uniref:sensor domain-containing protein n=1 Tax=Mycobacterium sp. TaxID=1785 RepID=UPI003D6B3A16
MRQRLLRIVAALVWVAVLALPVACTHVVAGSPSYATQTQSANLPLVKNTGLLSLMLKPDEIGAVMKAPPLEVSAIYTTVSSVRGVSDQKCGGAISAGAEPMYRGSGYRAIVGLGMHGPQDRVVDEAAATFGDADEAHKFVATGIAQWADCVNRTLTITLPGRPVVNWIASGPSTSYGVHVLLRRQEGGQGYVCSHAMAARSNVAADVLACSYDEALINEQAASIVNMMLAKIHE